MDEKNLLAEKFEANRSHLQAVAYRMLGSVSDADVAVQETWIRLNRSDAGDIDNLSGWLTTVVSRVCLDMMRSRKSRREESLEVHGYERRGNRNNEADPAQEMLMADSVGLALLVVLETLTPAERIAFVLHDMFDLTFDEIAPIVGRSTAAARQLGSRARRRVRGTATVPDADRARRREIVDAFLTASRGGDFNALLAVLDPDVVLRTDGAAGGPTGKPMEVRGAEAVATRAVKGGARAAQAALIDGVVGVVVAPRGRLFMVIKFMITAGKIVEFDVIADPERLRRLDLAVLHD